MNKILILFIVCLCLIIPNVMGETISGTLGTTSPSIVSTNYGQTSINGATCIFKYLAVSDIASVSSVTSTEAGYLSGVTSALQNQIDAKAPIVSPSFTGLVSIEY
jgi:hypothetical protein